MRRILVAGLVLAWCFSAGPAGAQTDLYDCPDFQFREDAQAVLDANPADPYGLDGNDDDGLACEDLPLRGSQTTPTTTATTSRPNTGANQLPPQAPGTVDAGEFCADARAREVTTAKNGRAVVCLFDPDSNRHHWVYDEVGGSTATTAPTGGSTATTIRSATLVRTGSSSNDLAQMAGAAVLVGLVLFLLGLPTRQRAPARETGDV